MTSTPPLGRQTRRVYNLMKDQQWRTISQMASLTDCPETTASARLRDLRKEECGGHIVERKRASGVSRYKYRLIARGHVDVL